jgi:hypothetical protein
MEHLNRQKPNKHHYLQHEHPTHQKNNSLQSFIFQMFLHLITLINKRMKNNN